MCRLNPFDPHFGKVGPLRKTGSYWIVQSQVVGKCWEGGMKPQQPQHQVFTWEVSWSSFPSTGLRLVNDLPSLARFVSRWRDRSSVGIFDGDGFCSNHWNGSVYDLSRESDCLCICKCLVGTVESNFRP